MHVHVSVRVLVYTGRERAEFRVGAPPCGQRWVWRSGPQKQSDDEGHGGWQASRASGDLEPASLGLTGQGGLSDVRVTVQPYLQ